MPLQRKPVAGADKRKGKYGTNTKWVSAAEEEMNDLADFFRIFGDATRLKILYALKFSEMCVLDIAQLLGMSQSAISHQLRVLKQMDLVKNRRDGKTIFYSLADAHIVTILSQGLDHIEE